MTNVLRMLVPPTPDGKFSASAALVCSGGYLLRWNTGTDTVASGTTSLASYVVGDVAVSAATTSQNCVGICLTDAASGGITTIGFNGVYILPAGSVAVSGGFPIVPSGYGTDSNMVELSITTGSVAPIGRALTTATLLTGYAIVKLNI